MTKDLAHVILRYVAENPGCKMQQIMEHIKGASRVTVSRRLAGLVENGELRREGTRRGTRYYRDDIRAYFAIPSNQRRPVPYDFNRLATYRPDETRLVPQALSEELQAMGSIDSSDIPTYTRAIRERFMVDLSWASSNLEGNTYTYLDTEALILYGQASEGRTAEETQMILNHKEAIKYLLDNITNITVSEIDIKAVHALLARDLLRASAGGVIRQIEVSIGNSVYKPLDNRFQLNDEFSSLVDKASQITDPIEQSVFLLAFISYLQPFEDVNKRTSRLFASAPLLKNGLGPLSFMDFDRRTYVTAILAFYELGASEPLVKVYADGYKKSIERYKVDLNKFLTSADQQLGFRYRMIIDSAIRELIQLEKLPELTTVPDGDRARLMAIIQDHIVSLSPERAVLYGLLPQDILAWRKTVKVDPQGDS